MGYKIYGPTGVKAVYVKLSDGDVHEHSFEKEQVGDSLARVLPVSTCSKCGPYLCRYHGFSTKPSAVALNVDEKLEMEELVNSRGVMLDRMAKTFTDNALSMVASDRNSGATQLVADPKPARTLRKVRKNAKKQ